MGWSDSREQSRKALARTMIASSPKRPSATIERLAWLCLAGIALYVALDVLLFFLRPDLPILRRAESDYGNGPWAWIMDANFLLRCAFSLAAAGALWAALPRSAISRVAIGLLALWAIASGALAFFADDYEGTLPTAHGKIHLLAAGIAFLSCLIATLLLTMVLARLWRTRATDAALVVIWLVAALGLFLLGRAGFRPGALDGLYERIFLGGELLWMGVAMWGVIHRPVA